VGYLSGHVDALSEESRERLTRNPLRILDSKNDSDRAVIKNAPRLEDSLNEPSRAFFSTVCEGLDRLGIAFTHNTHLVRGLDYYCHTAFEFTTTELGAQGAVLAGGRYDGLVEVMGGPATPGVGWAAGLERLAMLADAPPDAPRPVAVIPIGDDAQTVALEVTNQLRRAGFTVDLGFRGNLSKRMKKANQARAVAAVIIGEDEIERGAATVRDLESGDQQEVPFNSLAGALGVYKHASEAQS
ncbi:MAG: histidine--tRNA ligase, partial [Chromatiales bacterium]|nr:histidine--tRNA ligase [Chromatiales bacterium]